MVRPSWSRHHDQSTARPAEEWVRRSAPELRIVPEDPWQTAQDRLAAIRTRLKTITARTVDGRSGPRRHGNESQYLLSGFPRCAAIFPQIVVPRLCYRRRFACADLPHRRHVVGCYEHAAESILIDCTLNLGSGFLAVALALVVVLPVLPVLPLVPVTSTVCPR